MMNKKEIYKALGLTAKDVEGGNLLVHTPIDGTVMANVTMDTVAQTELKIGKSVDAFKIWRNVPAPRRGELVRILGNILRDKKEALGALVTLECGKIYQEGLGEVQEMIDICDFAVGQSRMLHGLTIVSERPLHKMREIWQPLGPVGIISAFNFPVAVWSWNTALALVCGNSVIWKPSEKSPVTALACQKIFEMACAEFGDDAPANLSQVLTGERDIGEVLVADERIPLISATGSSAMGKVVGAKVAGRFGKSILELGGNNAIIVSKHADLDLAYQGIVFGSVGTCGQRCTTTRRLFIHEDVYDEIIPRIKKAFSGVTIGNPLDEETLMGPLVDEDSFNNMENALSVAKKNGASITGGGRAMA
ncbi:MAG: aldehyde dehydrogenase family protein, partial [Kordiimonadaceae bacterium]|nr:aldehyde dehydrogenase family protein [Kordiimonadaceae bacterium]